MPCRAMLAILHNCKTYSISNVFNRNHLLQSNSVWLSSQYSGNLKVVSETCQGGY